MAATSRKAFLAAAAAAGVAGAVPSGAGAQSSPSPSPHATAAPTPVSMEIAAGMRRFDPSLSEDQVRAVARGIDDQNRSGASIRKRRPLHGGDEPTPEFRVR